MRLLYGVQATGNGHISRARAMQQALAPLDIQVDFLFSGRSASQLFDMAAFGNYQWRQGLSFVSKAGKISHWHTWQQANFRQLWRDIHQLETRRYDVVLTDFEPVTAWAARRQGTPLIALGHQYALTPPTPLCGMDWFQRTLLAGFAPARHSIGLHWHHFGYQQQQDRVILPPIVDLPIHRTGTICSDTVLVYLPFEDPADVLQWLAPLQQYKFCIYGAGLPAHTLPHLQFCAPSVHVFKQDLIRSAAVISNAGFELISEALQLGKRIMVKPLLGQPEQRSNALALQQLGLACAQNQLNSQCILEFLTEFQPDQSVRYPDVAAAIAQWLVKGNWYDHSALQQLWQKVEFQADVTTTAVARQDPTPDTHVA